MLTNVERLHQLMAQAGVDAIVATSPENVTYTSGFWAISQWIRRGPQAYVLWPAPSRGESCLIASSSTLDLVADQKPWVRQVRRYEHFVIDRARDAILDDVDDRQVSLYELPDDGDALSALCMAIRGNGLDGGCIAVDELGLLPGYLEALRERLPGCTWLPGFELLRRCRAVKTGEEIARLRRAAEIAERSIAAALRVAKVGASEIDLARAFHEQTVREGAFPVLGCIGFGTRSAMINVQPSGRPLRSNDVIRFDVGGRYRHYRADIARIAVKGEPSTKLATYYHALHAGVRHACDIIRPGVAASDIFHTVVETVRSNGLPHYQRSHVGHGIGIDGYDIPVLSPSSRDVVEEDMVLCVETPYYELGQWGLQVEDMMVVRTDGVESLMSTDGCLMTVPC